MQLEALKIYCDVVRWSSFSQAARENGITQSSASQTVSQLETRMGVKLIDRSKRPLAPTEQGRIYYEGCKDLVDCYYEIENRVKASADKNLIEGAIRVAAIYSVGIHHMSRFIHLFKATHSKIHVRLDYQHPEQVRESVLANQADLGLVSFPGKWPDLRVIPWRSETMVAIVHPKHQFANHGEIDPVQLNGQRFVHYAADLAIRKAIDRHLRQYSISYQIAFEFDNIENIKRAIEADPEAVAIIPLPAAAKEVKAGDLRALKLRGIPLTRPLAIIHRNKDLPLHVGEFLALLREHSNGVDHLNDSSSANQPGGSHETE